MSEAQITVTKMDAARRQLATAIRLWFEDGDPVAIHTLAAAAHEIIHTLFKRRGLTNLMFDSEIIKDEHRGDFARFVKAASTFFKHAQRDPDATLEFNPGMNHMFIMMSVAGIQKMDLKLGMEERAFFQWLIVTKPHIVAEVAGKRIPINTFTDVAQMPKDQFFAAFKLLWTEGQIAGQT